MQAKAPLHGRFFSARWRVPRYPTLEDCITAHSEGASVCDQRAESAEAAQPHRSPFRGCAPAASSRSARHSARRRLRRTHETGRSSHLAPLLRHAPACGRPRHSHGPVTSRPQRCKDDHDLHTRSRPRRERCTQPSGRSGGDGKLCSRFGAVTPLARRAVVQISPPIRVMTGRCCYHSQVTQLLREFVCGRKAAQIEVRRTSAWDPAREACTNARSARIRERAT